MLRSTGAQNGCIVAFEPGTLIGEREVAKAVGAGCRRAQHERPGSGQGRVGASQPYEWTQTEWALGAGYGTQADPRFHVVAYDFGIKRNILRMLASRGCRVTVVPAQTSGERGAGAQARRHLPVQRPGRPRALRLRHRRPRAQLIDTGMPTFGICLGHQILALASGAKTFKMKFGHHGANHPVKDLDTGRVSASPARTTASRSTRATLPANLRPTHVSLFDGTLQGLARTDRPAFCFQGHPEASPGPHDIGYLFDRFTALMDEGKNA